jgi:hypothetical protein
MIGNSCQTAWLSKNPVIATLFQELECVLAMTGHLNIEKSKTKQFKWWLAIHARPRDSVRTLSLLHFFKNWNVCWQWQAISILRCRLRHFVCISHISPKVMNELSQIALWSNRGAKKGACVWGCFRAVEDGISPIANPMGGWCFPDRSATMRQGNTRLFVPFWNQFGLVPCMLWCVYLSIAY